MDQERIGKFIAECRKDKGLTQMQLAEKLGITNRAVSKWENAKNLPDIATMIPLCEILDISVNELLSGERLSMENYEKNAEENLMEVLGKVETILNRNQTSKIMLIILLLAAACLLWYQLGEGFGRFLYHILH